MPPLNFSDGIFSHKTKRSPKAIAVFYSLLPIPYSLQLIQSQFASRGGCHVG